MEDVTNLITQCMELVAQISGNVEQKLLVNHNFKTVIYTWNPISLQVLGLLETGDICIYKLFTSPFLAWLVVCVCGGVVAVRFGGLWKYRAVCLWTFNVKNSKKAGSRPRGGHRALSICNKTWNTFESFLKCTFKNKSRAISFWKRSCLNNSHRNMQFAVHLWVLLISSPLLCLGKSFFNVPIPCRSIQSLFFN